MKQSQQNAVKEIISLCEQSESQNSVKGPTTTPVQSGAQSDITSSMPNMAPVTEDQLLARLIDLERESVAVSRVVDQVGELARRASESGQRQRPASHKDLAFLRNTCTALAEQLEAFDVNNRVLRSLLRQREEKERDGLHHQEQRERLLTRHAELEAMNKRFQTEVLDKEKQLHDLQVFIDAQRDENLAIASSHDMSESTRVHLQKQLRVKESDCNRMAVQIRQLETQMAQERIDTQHLCDLLQEAKDKTAKDKHALKRAARAQKERANRLAEEVDRLHTILVDKEPLLEQLVKEEEERVKDQANGVNDDECDGKEEEIEEQTAMVSQSSPQLNSSNSIKGSLQSVTDEERKSYECLIQQHQQECQRAEQRILNYELRIRNAEERNKSLANQLTETSGLVESCRREVQETDTARQSSEFRWREAEARLEEVRRERDALQAQLESALADARRQRELVGESAVERRLRQRVKGLEDEQCDLRTKMERMEADKSAMEQHYTQRLADLKSRIEVNASKDKSMRMYVQHLKDSYQKCFGDV